MDSDIDFVASFLLGASQQSSQESVDFLAGLGIEDEATTAVVAVATESVDFLAGLAAGIEDEATAVATEPEEEDVDFLLLSDADDEQEQQQVPEQTLEAALAPLPPSRARSCNAKNGACRVRAFCVLGLMRVVPWCVSVSCVSCVP